ncbi:DNA-3-methyladenine glycosylase [Tsukamurella ocularis]|uniref:DNA-3-methyladenine glycosylase n=1 Tax=Tsukamurella ocularis TaxID=1970234 RepID=UPI00216956B0|nr:DNA-3-methyladenine glycosylase [Tsukamurella ocularis]MCS3782356.1 DNA-3-methyladenine glycosylase [Tsukamurella ocularis]MCS3789760.1 DNA-3-methyladenine glycosylase [Tsukamurella ocularis]MCS3853146.1 DNA-3-methyladenine glycosylase [Tsukamurella ocularis]
MTANLRDRLAVHPLKAARLVLGSVLVVDGIRARIVEVEAYGSPENGPWPDAAAHTYPGPTPRNAVMFGPAGHLYVYLSYGIHQCVNITAGPDGVGSGVLLRAAAIESGLERVRERRAVGDPDARLAAGPGRLGQALGITVADKGIDVLDPSSAVQLEIAARRGPVVAGPRIGISRAVDLPWRLWLQGHPSVSR